MTINLKQIRALDTDNIKLDKINYNFDQLIANGGGPKGYIGSNGNNGAQGFQGASGVQGGRGSQGTKGPDAGGSDSYWVVVSQNLMDTGNVMATMFSKHPIVNIDPAPLFASVVAAGYITGDTGYAQQQPPNGLPKYQWVINRNSSKVASNLRFKSSGVFGNAFDITMNNSDGLYKLYLGFINNQNSQLNLKAKSHIIKSTGNTVVDLFKISTSDGSTLGNTFFEKQVTFNAALRIGNQGANVNKIVTAINSAGNVAFKTTEELGGSVKIGTIISILPSIFIDSTRFVYSQTIDTNSDLNNPIKIKIGAGIGDYIGWYVCNGQRWTDGVITDPNNPDFYKWQVPDLNSYSYQIIGNPMSADPNSQGNINVNNIEIQLMGGAPIFVAANEVGESSAQYDIDLTNNSNDPQISSNNSGVQFKIKKLPQIIYLGANNLYWSQLGTGQITVGDYSATDYSTIDYNAY
jgi:hypothetical protein